MPKDMTRPTGETTPRSLLVEGWRGVNHSYALINQYQILELLKLDGLRLFHRDLPFAFGHWTRAANGAGFSDDDLRRIDGLDEPAGEAIDCVYRICSPFRPGAPDDRRKTVTFMITELGLTPESFARGSERSDFFTRDDNTIVTSTNWSRDRIVEYGFDAGKVAVVPLGVDTAAFYPSSEAERNSNRAALGIADDETVFMNIGVAIWNKGIDLLLAAFANLRCGGRRVRLILKDQSDVYGISVMQMIRSVGAAHPALLRPDTIAAISVVPGNMSRDQLRLLHAVADCYVSPYRAEGFNLPVLEAIACARPVIVTRGGATDDFCTDDVAFRISGKAGHQSDLSKGTIGRFIEPDFDELVEAMDALATRRHGGLPRFEQERARILQAFNWHRAAAGLARLTVGALADDRRAIPQVTPRPVTQQDILALIATIRPMAMAAMAKVRVGNDYDGGYVLPEAAMDCDGVLSIGVGSDVSFDLVLANRGARVLQFDHTVEGSPVPHPNFAFHKKGWGATGTADLLDFEEICVRFAQLGAKRAMLKFDIEGAEYEALASIEPGRLAEFDVIACEIHDLAKLGERGFYDRVSRALEILSRDHAPVHIHANNYRGVAMVAGVPVPDVLEISYLRRDLDAMTDFSRDPIPGPLDRPNHPYRPDICMTAYQAPSVGELLRQSPRHDPSHQRARRRADEQQDPADIDAAHHQADAEAQHHPADQAA